MTGKRLSDHAVRRWAWATCGFFFACIAAASVVDGLDDTEVTDWGSSSAAADLAFVVAVALFPIVGMLITRRQPRNRVGWLLLAVGVAWGVSGLADAYVRWALIVHPGSLPGGFEVQAFSSASWLPPMALMGIFLILLFPDGRLPSPRWRPLAWLGAGVGIVGTFVIALAPGGMEEDVPVPTDSNPLSSESLEPIYTVLLVVVLPLLPLCILASACALVLRFRRSQGVERLQLKWLTTAGAFVALTFLVTMATSLPSAFQEDSADPAGWLLALQNLSILSFALIPISIGVAVTRHGLYGIDAIISRALLFGALGVFVTGVYVAIVVGVGAAIGESQPSVALSVVATAVVAVAFQPVRQRVHRVVNRLVYGSRATPYEVLSDFASRMTGTYTTAELLPRMAQTVSECLGGARVEVWLHDNRRLVREVCWPEDRKQAEPMPIGADGTAALGGDRVVPVRHHDELLGLIAVTKPAGEHVTPTEDRMLNAVASQAGLVLRNVRLLDDLRSSSERLVRTQDVERRRLERNLHDGAQQSLVSVALLLRLAAARVTDEPMRAAIGEASAQLQQAIDELRELARGIHPAILTERGLGPALTSLAERSPVPVRIDLALAERPPATVEGTLYFVVAEALTNVARYSGASGVTVTISNDGDTVTAAVVDDGVGGADPTRGSGLRGLADRVAAVDGSIEVHSPPGQGTTITCRLPVPASRAAVLEPVT